MEEKVTVVNEKDEVLGEAEKMRVHQEGKLHRPFSLFIFNSKGQMQPNPQEAEDFEWMDKQTLVEEVKQYPKLYTQWFRIVLDRVVALR